MQNAGFFKLYKQTWKRFYLLIASWKRNSETFQSFSGINKHFFFELTCLKVFDVSVNPSNASFLSVSQSSAIFPISYRKKKLGCWDQDFFHSVTAAWSRHWKCLDFTKFYKVKKERKKSKRVIRVNQSIFMTVCNRKLNTITSLNDGSNFNSTNNKNI